jgi:hypothetical protein
MGVVVRARELCQNAAGMLCHTDRDTGQLQTRALHPLAAF